MTTPKFISILEYATFQVQEIQAVTLAANHQPPTIRIWIKRVPSPFEFNIPDAANAQKMFTELTTLLCQTR